MQRTPYQSPKSRVHLFFSPPKSDPDPQTKIRQEAFVLDCTNPLRSKLPEYRQAEDQFGKSYLNIVFSRLKSSKQNRHPRGSYTANENKRAISRQNFKSYLQQKLQLVNQAKKDSEGDEARSYLMGSSSLQLSKQKNPWSGKQSAFLQRKFRCFKKKSKATVQN